MNAKTTSSFLLVLGLCATPTGCDPVDAVEMGPEPAEFRNGDDLAGGTSKAFCEAWDGRAVLIDIPWDGDTRRYLRSPNSELQANLVTHEERILPDDGTHSFRWRVECDGDGEYVRFRHGFGTNEYMSAHVDPKGKETIIVRNTCEFPPQHRRYRFYVTPIPGAPDTYNISLAAGAFHGWGVLRALGQGPGGKGYFQVFDQADFDPDDMLYDFHFSPHPDPVADG